MKIKTDVMRGARLALKMTQTDLADKLNLTVGRISQIESGATVTAERVVQIAQALGLTASALLGGGQK